MIRKIAFEKASFKVIIGGRGKSGSVKTTNPVSPDNRSVHFIHFENLSPEKSFDAKIKIHYHSHPPPK
ncbi:MAG: hypothetical protein LLG13_03665 [Bacteroidales bacterium]|nr:hypothetical protein [Bacteroidales bacterium]